MKVQAKTLPGFMELIPGEQILFNKIKDTIKRNYEKYGFLPLDTPTIESSEVLLAKAGGETEKQIYNFTKGENELCLRFDLTVPLAKYVAINYNELAFPFARYQIGKVYRGERPQKGRFREFYQCDIDVVGNEKLSTIYDAQMPAVMYNVFKELNIGDFTIFVSNRKILLGLLESLELSNLSVEILRIIDKADKIGLENVKDCLKELQVNNDKIDSIINFISISGNIDGQFTVLEQFNINNENFLTGIEELKTVVKYMGLFGISKENFGVNLKICRGLDYYTGTVYETFLKGYESLGSICSGGRYDNLAQFYTDKKFPGVGMSIGLTRLFYQLEENKVISADTKSTAKIIIIPMGETMEECINIANVLRESNINTELYLEDTKFKNKLQYASKNEINYALIVGEDEVKSGKYALKDLKKFEQNNYSIDEIINLLK